MAYKLQRSFSGGEITPMLHNRNDVEYFELHKQALAKMRNTFPTPYGPAISRNGTEYINQVSGLTGRIFPFYIDKTKSYAVIVGAINIDIFNVVTKNIAISIVSPLVANDLLNVIMVPGENKMLLFSSATVPQELIYTDETTWTIQDVPFTFPVGGKIWPNHPELVGFYGGRMVVARDKSEKNGLWLSKPRDYFNFDTGDISNQVPDDALYLPIDRNGEINWILGNTQLFVGMNTGEHVIFAENAAIAANNAQTFQQSTYGSERVQALVVNGKVVFIDDGGTRVKSANYFQNTRNMNAVDLSYFADHMVTGINEKINYFTFARFPFGVLYFVLNSEKMLTCNVEKDRGFFGWSVHTFNEGVLLDVMTIKEDGIDIVYVLIGRGTNLFLEKFSKNINIYMDSYVRVSVPGSVKAKVFFGFSHLIGMDIDVLADGAYYDDLTVSADGSITVPYPVLSVEAGIGFVAEIETLPEMDERQDGTSFMHQQRFSKIMIAVRDSARPIVNEHDLYQRFPTTLMDIAEPMKTEILEFAELGWSKGAIVNVKQPLPYAMTITGLGGKLNSNKM